MRVESLELKHIGCFAEKHLRFSDLTVIYGENRTGKSTLVYALFFALFGKHLNPQLRVQDLCRKGEKSGSVTVCFAQNKERFRLCRSTEHMPSLARKSEGADLWQPVANDFAEILHNVIPSAPETASLTSFFRESELIHFLQDVPRYDKTLVQSMTGMDRVQILRSAFKKALGKAKEYRKAIRNSAPKRTDDPLQAELVRRQLLQAEKELRHLDGEYEQLRSRGPEYHTVYHLLQNQHLGKKKELAHLRQQQGQNPRAADLEKELEQTKKLLRESDTVSRSAEKLLRQSGALSQQRNQLEAQIRKFLQLEGQSLCPMCEQPLVPERTAKLIAKEEQRKVQIGQAQKEIESALESVLIRKKEIADARKRAEQIPFQLKEICEREARIKELEKETARLASEVREKEPSYGKSGEDDPAQKLENRRKLLQEEIVRCRVQMGRQEESLRRLEENRKHAQAADRKVLLCQVACQALDGAIANLGSRVMEKVRESVGAWSEHFTFLNRFDIDISGTELLPVIQARGYRYKLSQMSKSERIFLYLMLKLAMGDALGHPDLFVLDDPADGLDHKRKQTLAWLLSKVAEKRQVIVTTNDRAFADLFPAASRMELNGTG
ncbi:MAG: AAA family ATPase [Desulfobacterales bacterium]